ncbi:hypothetical protein ACMY0W_11365 [Bacteroides sp. KG69]|uniref:hypothetical protein n=1 Tax=Bacteroides sp. KG69 TaxID=3397825 RepID=UPI003D9912F0
MSQDPISIAGGLNVYAYVHDTNSWIDPFGLSGIIYLRTRIVNGEIKSYIGKSKSLEVFQRRQYAHNRALRKVTEDPTAKYKFDILEQDIQGKDNLAFKEELNIRKRGGIDALDNKISAMNDMDFFQLPE